MQQSTRQLGQIAQFLEAVPLAMLAVDRRMRVIAANAAAEAMFGPDLTDRPFVTVLRHPGVIQSLDWVIDPTGHAAPPVDPQLPAPPPGGHALRASITAKGRQIPCDITTSPLPPAMGEGALIALADGSGIEQADQMRRDFVANVSHELRTPLTALIGFIETLRGPARDDAGARSRFLGIMEAEAGRMNRLVADLLSLSRVESDERRRPSGRVELTGLLRGVVDTLVQRAEAAGVKLDLTLPPGEVRVTGDADQLVQVFQNLVENAVKYGGSGGWVGVSLAHVAHEPRLRGPGWSVLVEDRGDGIEALHLPRLTERFYRVDAHRSRAEGGTGLGLAIVKHIINRHRGQLRIESVKGKGSRFTVILPDRGTGG
ncbi:sensor histidine kinase [Paracoccus zhejiangensis]|uniref:histidine kinase n=1 Tax=Paracoccus zhejiangensis TaxID=1077935 RepID=A0A2H5EWX7_9RHOB|nr:ATP-binding protein [Paracoccus zhejiangensis]AUH63816.1 two-component sensor histidine kinase [Paracoccus zhejiangensis]